MGLYQSLKRVVPLEWKVKIHEWKATLVSRGTLLKNQTTPVLKDRALRIRNRIKGGFPIPPGELIYLVAGHREAAWFLRGGSTASQAIRETLEKHGIKIEEFYAILDFGCGVGRIMRHWDTLQGPALYGTDYNPNLIAWAQSHLKFAKFQINTLSDRLPFQSAMFDFVYAFSVFTHLSEQLQAHWIEELSRVLRPGGYLYLTTHGEHYFSTLPLELQEQLRNGQMVAIGAGQSGSNHCAAYHPEKYVRENLARNFVVVDLVKCGARGDSEHDVYLLKKTAG